MTKFIDPSEPIAIIGLGGLFPGSHDIPGYWDNVLKKVDSIVEVPRDRWDWRLYYDSNPAAPDKTYSKIGGFIRDFKFDPLKLRIPPPVAQQMDTVQQLAVMATAEALRDSGYEDKPFDRQRTAVVFGNSMGGTKKEATDLRVYVSSFQQSLTEAPAFARLPQAQRAAISAEIEASVKAGLCTINEDTMPGELSNVIAGRVANTFNLNGANFTADAACAASLAAIAQAVNGLRLRQFDMVVTGGVDQMMGVPAYVKFCKIGALSPDGSRPFDAGANGFVMGEGAGVLILKRLSDARLDGDKIYALIRAIGASSDGRGKGITAPNPKGQRLAIERTFEQLDYAPEDVGLLEAHGTSTKVGDVVEAQTASEVFRAAPASIALGSVKSQIGHLKAAAGAASIIKTALALRHKLLPPSINFKTPNPGVDWKASPFFVNTEPREWKAKNGKPRRANVSAFGFGGTNFHVALEEANEGTLSWTPALPAAMEKEAEKLAGARPARALPPALGGEALILRGGDPDSLLNSLENLKAEIPSQGPLTALSRKVNFSAQGPLVLSIAAESGTKLLEKIDLVLRSRNADLWKKAPSAFKPKGIHTGRKPAKRPKIGFMFPGQGSQYVDMLKDLKEKYQVVADTFAEADEIMSGLVGEKLSDLLFTKGGETPEQVTAMQERIKQTEITQPAVLTADIALLRLLKSYGVEPDVVCGHSLGEYGALVAAGVLEFKDALLAVSSRAKEMAGVKVADCGKMASVAAPVEKVEPLLRKIDGYVIAANKNCPIQTVIAGATRAVEQAVELFASEGIQAQFIEVSHAFHSEIVAPAQVPYGKFLERIDLKTPRVPILSNVTADYYPKDLAGIRKLMVSQIASPVEFIREAHRMYKDGVRVFVEIGPKRALTAFVTSVLEGKEDVHVVPSNHPKRGGIHEFNDMLARLAAAGVGLDLAGTDPASSQSVYTADYRAWCLSPKIGAPSSPAPEAAVPAKPAASPAGAPLAAAQQDLLRKWDIHLGTVTVSGIAAGTPGQWDRVFREDNLDVLLRGQNLIGKLSDKDFERQLDKNILRLIKSERGDHRIERIESAAEVVQLAAQAGAFDLAAEFGFKESVTRAMDVSTRLAVAAGILALKDAGIPLVRTYKRTTTGGTIPTGWALPPSMRADTGVIFASAYPSIDSMAAEVSRYLSDRYRRKPLRELAKLFESLVSRLKDPEDRVALQHWYATNFMAYQERYGTEGPYEFSRDFLLRVMPLGHSQLAQWVGAQGPATHISAACASTTQAVSMAEDWIRLGRARRVVVIAGDDVTGPNLREWMTSGFLAAGAATTQDVVSEAALPFDRRRNGMILGMGAVGLVVEDAGSVAERGMRPLTEILASQYENSAFHITRLKVQHVAEVMDRLVSKAEKRYGLRRSEIAAKTLFMSHETYTPARGGSASAEVEALRHTFGPDVGRIIVTNTKGYTGHTMGASVEDPAAIRALVTGILPPIANYKEADPELAGITLSRGGEYDVEYAIRLAAGFGSQIAMTLMRRAIRKGEARVADPVRHSAWLREISGQDSVQLEVVHNTLRVRETAGAQRSSPAPEAPLAPVSRPMSDSPAPAAGASASPLSETQVRADVLALVGEKTGYPAEMLELDLDMEADLGIDTVKQAELIGLIREKYGIPRRENLSLKDYPTLRHVIRFVMDSSSGVSSPVAAVALAPSAAPRPTAPTSAQPAAAARPVLEPAAPAASTRRSDLNESQVQAEITALVSEKTGYPAEMLELDLDMEADLGIDTVKQAELIGLIREKYGIPRRENLSLKDYPTLRHVIRFVMEGAALEPSASGLEPGASAAVGAPYANGAHSKAAPRRSDLNESQVQAEITALVSEKTGYPAEMLELDLDMEADLGIDTVKQAELIGLIREKYGIPRRENLSLKDYPTLRHVIRFVMEGAAAGSTSLAAPPSASGLEPGAAAAAEVSSSSSFGRWKLEAYPRPAQLKPVSMAGHTVVLLTPDDAAAKPFIAAMQAAGGNPIAVRAADWSDAAKASAALRAALKQNKAQALLDLTGLALEDFGKLTPASFDKAYRKSARAFYLAAQALREDLLSKPSESWVLSLTRMDGAHGYALEPGGATGSFNPLAGTLTGLTKALRRELEGVRVQALDFNAQANGDDMARLALAELGSDDPRLEVGFSGGTRQALRLTSRELPSEGKRKIGPRSVMLITGGGQGLGAELAKELARRHKCPLILLGRTPLLKEAVAWARMTPEELKALKMGMWEDLKKDKTKKATPALLEREFSKVAKAIDLQKNIEEMCRLGSKVSYFAADMADSASVSKAAKAALRAHSAIDFVIHAAGLEESKLLADKKPEDFDRVVRAKAHGAFHLLKAVPPTRNQAWLFFSSVVGRFGNMGQTDYAAASDFLAKLACWLRGGRKTAMTFDLTAFSEIGMATRGGVELFLKSQGVDFMPPKTGVAMILEEMLRNAGDAEVLLAGSLGRMDSDGLMSDAPSVPAPTTKAPGSRPEAEGARADKELRSSAIIEQVISEEPGSELIAAKTFSVEGDAWLLDHAINRVPYVPGVMGIELFAESAARLKGQAPPALCEVAFSLPIKLLRNRPVTVRVEAREAALALLTDFVTPTGIKLGGPRVHFTAKAEYAARLTDAWKNVKKPALPKEARFSVSAQTVYEAYFHGPSFQVLAGVLSIDEAQSLALYRKPAKALGLFEPGLIFHPMLIEAAFQACGYRDLHFNKRVTLPDSIGRVEVFGGSPLPEELYVWSLYKGAEGESKSVYDAYVFDASGKLWVALQDYRMIAVS